MKTLGDAQGQWHKVEGVLWALSAVAREATKSIKQNPEDTENREIVNLLIQVLNEINANSNTIDENHSKHFWCAVGAWATP